MLTSYSDPQVAAVQAPGWRHPTRLLRDASERQSRIENSQSTN